MKILRLSLLLFLPSAAIAQEGTDPADGGGNASAQAQEIKDYPRPLLLRPGWTSLHGEWDYSIGEKDAIVKPPDVWSGKTAVPAATSSPNPAADLDPAKRMWYRRHIDTPDLKPGQRLLLRCNGATTEAAILINGSIINYSKSVNAPFHTDISELLTKEPKQEIVISTWSDDPESNRAGLTGEVWLETLPHTRISSLKVTTDIRSGKVTVFAAIWGQANFRPLEAKAFDGEREVGSGIAYYHYKKGGYETSFDIPEPKLWSPENPKLYGLRIRIANEDKSTHDNVTSYFALREASNIGDKPRFALNGKQRFLRGIDAGHDHASLSDAEIRKQLEDIKAQGYNLVRKSGSMDSPRFYHWADRIGLLVWQDIPRPDAKLAKSKAWKETLQKMRTRYLNHPSIAIWPDNFFATADPPENLYTAGSKSGKIAVADTTDKSRATVIAREKPADEATVKKLEADGFSGFITSGKKEK